MENDEPSGTQSAKASGTNRRFEHTTTTMAERADIWRLWTDVTTWKHWDQGLEDATIDGPFSAGAAGEIAPKAGRKAQFTIVEMHPHASYTFDTKLPGARLRIRRGFVDAPTTTFRHSVSFEGPLATLWALVLGPGFRRQLPESMQLLAEQAEVA